MRTAVTDLLGIDVPILAFSHCRDVVAEVTRAGGMGVLGAVAHTPEQLEIDLAWIEEQVGDLPYGVDLIIPAKYAGDDQGGFTLDDIAALIPAEHRAFVDDILARYDVPPLPDDEGPGRAGWQTSGGDAPFSANRAGPQLEIALAHRTALVANALGPPPPEMIEQVKGAGKVVAALAGRGVHAERHVAAGVDLIVAQGAEAGGHTGEIGSMVLIPEVVDAVGDKVPVLAAGGIGTGRQIAAALALGADGVWMGSVWLATAESDSRPEQLEAYLRATSSDTVRSKSYTGKPARMLRTPWTDAWEAPDSPGTLPMPLQNILIAPANQAYYRAGRVDEFFVPVGQIVGSMNQVRPVRDVMFDMVNEYIETVERLDTITGAGE